MGNGGCRLRPHTCHREQGTRNSNGINKHFPRLCLHGLARWRNHWTQFGDGGSHCSVLLCILTVTLAKSLPPFGPKVIICKASVLDCGLVCLGYRNSSTYGWLNQQKCVFSHSGVWKSTSSVPAGLGSGGCALPGLQMAFFSLCLHTVVPLCTGVLIL